MDTRRGLRHASSGLLLFAAFLACAWWGRLHAQPSPNILPNGGFEEGSTGWTGWTVNASAVFDASGPVFEGVTAAHLRATAGVEAFVRGGRTG
ncbi:MAG: hypothetical protein EXR65_04810 [Dehalococcoidia bacterium]|nr:hypothetical protein [Dehalococcoidia bacterium]